MEKYSDSTLDVKFQSIEDKMDDHFEALTRMLGGVMTQTTKTNGNVQSLQLWRSYILGGMSVLTVFLIPTLTYFAYQIIQNTNHISAIDSVLTQILNKVD